MPNEDEFDALPDDFADFNFDAVPELNTVPQPPATSTAIEQEAAPPRPASADSSSSYSFDNDVNDSFLAAVDELEEGALRGESSSAMSVLHAQAQQPSPPVATDTSETVLSNATSASALNKHGKAKEVADFGAPPLSSSVPKRQRPRSPSSPSSAKKRKLEAEEECQDRVRHVLEGFEDEMTCPICCDIFACAHVGNSCGHTYCGDCGWQWMSKNERAPTCAVCRAALSKHSPIIPNFAVDNTVAKHVAALAANGEAAWQIGGEKYQNWIDRQVQWKKSSEARAKLETARRRFHLAAFTPEPEPLLEDERVDVDLEVLDGMRLGHTRARNNYIDVDAFWTRNWVEQPPYPYSTPLPHGGGRSGFVHVQHGPVLMPEPETIGHLPTRTGRRRRE